MTKTTTAPKTLANRRALVFFGGPLLISFLAIGWVWEGHIFDRDVDILSPRLRALWG